MCIHNTLKINAARALLINTERILELFASLIVHLEFAVIPIIALELETVMVFLLRMRIQIILSCQICSSSSGSLLVIMVGI